MNEDYLMELTEHITMEVNEAKDSVIVQTTSGRTKLDASQLNKLMKALKSLYFEINPLSRLLWQVIQNPQQEILKHILNYFESDPTISEYFQEYLIHLENQINQKLSGIYTKINTQVNQGEKVEEEDVEYMKYWEARRQRVSQAKNQFLSNPNPEELLETLAPNFSPTEPST
ncbi:MAG: hypothetical protein ACXABG_09415 [Promethearchaeota archaeon]|jgi:hypothetical protein